MADHGHGGHGGEEAPKTHEAPKHNESPRATHDGWMNGAVGSAVKAIGALGMGAVAASTIVGVAPLLLTAAAQLVVQFPGYLTAALTGGFLARWLGGSNKPAHAHP